MADRPIDHDIASGAGTVVGSAAKGAVAGVGFVIGAIALAAVGGIAVGTALYFATGSALAVIGGAALVAASSGIWGPFVIAGLGLGALFGGKKVIDEQHAFNARAQGHQVGVQDSLQLAHQQGLQAGYQAGAQAGSAAVLDRLQQIQQQAIAEQERLVQEREAAKAQATNTAQEIIGKLQDNARNSQAPAPAPEGDVVEQHNHSINASLSEHPNGERRADLEAKFNIQKRVKPEDIIAAKVAAMNSQNSVAG